MKNHIQRISHFTVTALLLLIFFSPCRVFAENDRTPLQVAQQLREHLGGLSNLSFNFAQRTKGQLSGRARQASGKAYFVKDDKTALMRWDYQAPERQVIVSDGKELSMYFENLNQMIIAPAESLSEDVTYSFFVSKTKIEDDFLVVPGIEANVENGDLAQFEVIKLIPKSPTSQIKNIRLWVTAVNHIKRIEILDTFDTLTLLNISNIEENSLSLSNKINEKSFFQFDPPQGTEIIRQ